MRINNKLIKSGLRLYRNGKLYIVIATYPKITVASIDEHISYTYAELIEAGYKTNKRTGGKDEN